MRRCKQKQCTFLINGQGCRTCSDCGVSPFLVSGDCLRCSDCENIPDNCRWDDGKGNKIDEKQMEKEKDMEEEDEMEVEIKNNEDE